MARNKSCPHPCNGQRLRALREEYVAKKRLEGLKDSIEEVAVLVGYCARYIRRAEAGAYVSLGLVKALAGFYKVDINTIIIRLDSEARLRRLIEDYHRIGEKIVDIHHDLFLPNVLIRGTGDFPFVQPARGLEGILTYIRKWDREFVDSNAGRPDPLLGPEFVLASSGAEAMYRARLYLRKRGRKKGVDISVSFQIKLDHPNEKIAEIRHIFDPYYVNNYLSGGIPTK